MLRIQKSDSEEQLRKDCLKGKPQAQRELYERFAPKMLAVCFRYIHDREEAEHVMIGGMVKVFEKLSQFQSEGSFEGWIRRIMANESLMYLRKNKNMSLQKELSITEQELNYEHLEDAMSADELLHLINELPVGYRTVFNLYAIEGFSHKEIADMLDINENTSKSQLSRARKYLQAELQKIEIKDNYKLQSHGE